MYKIAICDDDEKICSELEELIFQYGKSSGIKLDIDVFESGEELCDFLNERNWIDLLFLDIEFPKMNGIEIGSYIREAMGNETIHIVYISMKEDYYARLFDVRPMHFLLKPIDREKVINDIEKAFMLSGILGQVFTYKLGHCTGKVQIRDILYFESVERKIRIVTITGEIIYYGKIADILSELQQYRFLAIHRSYVVNYSHILKFKNDEMEMSNGDILPISRKKMAIVKEIQLRYERGEH